MPGKRRVHGAGKMFNKTTIGCNKTLMSVLNYKLHFAIFKQCNVGVVQEVIYYPP